MRYRLESPRGVDENLPGWLAEQTMMIEWGLSKAEARDILKAVKKSGKTVKVAGRRSVSLHR